jgi:ankyrin repeat protein
MKSHYKPESEEKTSEFRKEENPRKLRKEENPSKLGKEENSSEFKQGGKEEKPSDEQLLIEKELEQLAQGQKPKPERRGSFDRLPTPTLQKKATEDTQEQSRNDENMTIQPGNAKSSDGPDSSNKSKTTTETTEEERLQPKEPENEPQVDNTKNSLSMEVDKIEEMKEIEEGFKSEQEKSDENEKVPDENKDISMEEHRNDTVAKKLVIQSPDEKELTKYNSFADTSALSPIRDNMSEPDFNFNNLVTIEENQPGDKANTTMNEKVENPDQNDDDDTDLSEAETVVAKSPPRINKARKLIRKKEYDENRHNLKRKKRIYSSEDEDEDEDEDEANEDERYEEEETKNEMEEDEVQNDDEDTEKQDSHQNSHNRKSKDKPYKIKRDSGGRSLLQRACKKGDLKLIEDYLSRGADANEKDFGGFTCLHEAALEGHTEVVKLLIKYGADVNAKADAVGDSETPLIDAAENIHYDTVKILLENGADPTIYNIDGFTALTKIYNEHANDEEYSEIVQLLEDWITKSKQSTDSKVDNDVKSSKRTTVDDPNDTYFADLIKRKGIYKYAAEGSKELTANYFVSGNNLESRPDILNLAARNGHVELVDIILGLNPHPYDLNTENSCGITVLLASVGRGHFAVVESLLSKGADPLKRRPQDGLTALEIAQRSIHFDTKEVELLEKCITKKLLSAMSSGRASPALSLLKKGNETTKTDAEKHKSKPVIKDESESEEYNSSDDEIVTGRTYQKLDVEKKRKGTEVDKERNIKKLKRVKSDSKVKQQSSSVFGNTKEEGVVTQRVVSSSPQPPEKTKSKVIQPAPAVVPTPLPLTKAQEEQKAKNAEQARIWQEKVEAKKRARREMFLKSEKEKERKKQEEEERRAEEEKKLAEKMQEAQTRLVKEAEEKSKILQQKRVILRNKLSTNNYPIGLKHIKFNKQFSELDIKNYLPFYIFTINNTDYVIDLQVSLITSTPTSKFIDTMTDKIELTSTDKSKVWKLFFTMIGIDKKKPTMQYKLYAEGHSQFSFLLLHFVKYDEIVKWIKEHHPNFHEYIENHNQYNHVALETLQPFNDVSTKTIINETNTDFTIDIGHIEKCVFIPPNLKRRKDSLRTIQNATTPLW